MPVGSWAWLQSSGELSVAVTSRPTLRKAGVSRPEPRPKSRMAALGASSVVKRCRMAENSTSRVEFANSLACAGQ